ncbi:hypothetical protein [Kitasatospora phosalacinea]|uniref:hypothetical protein n=1 Tax=Kitasatospora phosalacinea TaxID=2065 RepID=UPI0025558140|nr:hypothetical protein [Kitasatospora phosalacinea]
MTRGSSSSTARPPGLGAGLTALIPHPDCSSSPDSPVLSTAGGRAAARLLQLRTVEVPVPVPAAAATTELVGLLLDDEAPGTRQAAAAVLEQLNTAAQAAGVDL